MARLAPAACSFCAMPQAMERLLASPNTTAVLPARSIILFFFLRAGAWAARRPTVLQNISRRPAHFETSGLARIQPECGIIENNNSRGFLMRLVLVSGLL